MPCAKLSYAKEFSLDNKKYNSPLGSTFLKAVDRHSTLVNPIQLLPFVDK